MSDSLEKPPKYLQAEEIRDKEITLTLSELHELVYGLDWIEIMRESVESRPTSWGVQRGEEYKAVDEWRNASDTLISPVWKRLFQNLYREKIADNEKKNAEKDRPDYCPHCDSNEEFEHLDVSTWFCSSCGVYVEWLGDEWELVDLDNAEADWDTVKQQVEMTREGDIE